LRTERTLSEILLRRKDEDRIRIAIVTARNSPAHKRVIYTLRNWGVKADEAFFLGGVKKNDVLEAFNAHIFFDDQDTHISLASETTPSGRVPYIENELLDKTLDIREGYRNKCNIQYLCGSKNI